MSQLQRKGNTNNDQPAAAVIGKDKRHQNILSTNASRHKFTKDSNKDDFYSTL